jgi:hypothetical protein
MRRKKEEEKMTPEEVIAKLLQRKAARRKAYFRWLEEHPGAPIDPELADGSEPFLRDDSSNDNGGQ